MYKPLIISVVRDKVMYDKCIAKNPFVRDCDLLPIDNSVENKGIPERYNQALDKINCGESRWIVFCHEDFQFLEPLEPILSKADVNRIYGPLGGVLKVHSVWFLGGVWYGECVGQITIVSDKDGSNEECFGKIVPIDTPVDTLDCECLIVHSTILNKYHLRFDEHLTYDLYAEDFCFGASINHGIKTVVVPCKCHHYSRGNVLQRYFIQKDYLDKKYPKSEVYGPVGFTIGGGRTVVRRIQKRVKLFFDRHASWVVTLIIKIMPKG